METLKKINYIFDKKQKTRIVFLFLAVFIGALMELLGISAIMPFVSIISDTSVIHTKYIWSFLYEWFAFENDTQFILSFSIVLIIIYIVKNLYLIFMYDIQYRFTYNNQRRLATRLADSYMKQTYLYHLSKNVTDLQRNVIDDVTMFFQAVLASIQFLTELCVCLLLMGYLLVLDKSITIGITIILVLFALFFLKVFKRSSVELGEKNRDTIAARNKWIRQSFEGIKEIKIVSRESYFLKKIDDNYKEYAEAIRKSQMISIMPRPIFEAVCVTALLAVVAMKISQGVNLEYFIPILSAFAIAAFRLLPSFGRLTSYINSIVYNKPAINAVYNDLKEVERLMEEHKEQYANRAELHIAHGVHVVDVKFRYPNVDKYVLDKVNLEIPKYKSVAFIGPSGAGKTTLADIILGILEPESGWILADQIDILTDPYGWHKNLGYIPQTIYLMDDSIRNNILFGVPETEVDENAIWRALDDAQLRTFVDELENGIDTVIGERGVRLSGGQRQRIGIARALYNNPEILVLDEATSSLDNETEAAVMDAINGLHGKKTMIIIAHRLSTIEQCDLIYEINGGKVNLKKNKDERAGSI